MRVVNESKVTKSGFELVSHVNVFICHGVIVPRTSLDREAFNSNEAMNNMKRSQGISTKSTEASELRRDFIP